jgi:hypothetical protein
MQADSTDPDVRKDKVLAVLNRLARVWLLVAFPFLADLIPVYFLTWMAWLGIVLIGVGMISVWVVDATFNGVVFLLGSQKWQDLGRTLVVPAVILLAIAIRDPHIGLTAKVAISEPMLREYVANASAADSGLKIHQVGLFRVWQTSGSPDWGVAMYYESCLNYLDSSVLVYVPEGQEPPRYLRDPVHLYGPWYKCYWRF